MSEASGGYAVSTRPSLVATDLDGTLLRSDGSVSARTRLALAALEACGVDVVFVTARPPRWLDELAQVVGAHGTVIAANGAFVYDVRSRTVLRHDTLADDLVDALVTELRDAVPGVAFAAERQTGAVMEPAYAAPRPHGVSTGAVVMPIEERDDDPVGKLLAVRPAGDPDRFLETVVRIVGDRAHVAFSGARGLAEINAKGVTKAAALVRWTSERGVEPEQVWAFGDMPNDLPMLRWAGRAFAVANAHPDVLAAVDTVCASNDDDGVARVLERLVTLSGS
ncbi:MAG: HAD family hydrolase [Dermatophilaceae bacterium]